jgi:amino acid permease
MIIENPIVATLLILLVIFEIAFIVLDSKEHFEHFRDYIDAVILLTFFFCIYFVIQFIRAKRNAPIRVTAIDPAQEVRTKTETTNELNKLFKDKRFIEHMKKKN